MTTFEVTNEITIEKSFNQFHKKNPEIYEQIKKLCLEAINAGKTKISIKTIIGYIRYEMFIKTEDENSKYKINDAYTSRYARLFIKEFPQYAIKIETRKIRSK